MAVEVFGVTHASVKGHHFPDSVGFSSESSPSSTTVGEMVTAEGALLAGLLRVKGIAAATVAADTGSAAYSWCADVVRYGAAVRAWRAGAHADPAVVKAWQAAYEWRLKALDKYGAAALGDESLDGDGSPSGPSSHVSDLGLEVDEDGVSEAIHRLRRDDDL